MKMHAVVVAGIVTLFSGCFQSAPKHHSTRSSSDGGSVSNRTCQDSKQECLDWRCASGRVTETTPDTNWAFAGTEATLPLAGEFLSLANGYRVTTFRVVELDGGSLSATYETRSCAPLTISLIDDQHATMTYDGVTFDGHGALSLNQQQALDSLRQSPFIDALVQVPLELGCRPSMPARPLAVLLFPWQLFLKYDSAPSSRVQSLEALAAGTQCEYFGDRSDHETVDGHARMGPLQFAPSDVIPNVFGTFPLDAVGATEDPTQLLEGDVSGPSGGRAGKTDAVLGTAVGRCGCSSGADGALSALLSVFLSASARRRRSGA
jgi:hypothetical protein